MDILYHAADANKDYFRVFKNIFVQQFAMKA